MFEQVVKKQQELGLTNAEMDEFLKTIEQRLIAIGNKFTVNDIHELLVNSRIEAVGYVVNDEYVEDIFIVNGKTIVY